MAAMHPDLTHQVFLIEPAVVQDGNSAIRILGYDRPLLGFVRFQMRLGEVNGVEIRREIMPPRTARKRNSAGNAYRCERYRENDSWVAAHFILLTP